MNDKEITLNLSEESIQQLGSNLTKAALKEITRYLAAILIGVTSYAGVKHVFQLGKDDTDPEGYQRSGLRLYTDHGTGIQYLSDGNSITPRLKATGELCIKEDSDD